MSSPAAPINETPSERQERIRRERRAAKLAAGGNARLAKITGVSGRPAPAPEEAPLVRDESPRSIAAAPPSSSTAPPPSHIHQPTVSSADDPEEIDISNHAYTPSRSLTPLPPNNPNPNSFNASANEDSSLRMLQQLMGGLGGENAANGGDPLADLPPGMAQMMQSMMGGAGGAGGGGPGFPPGMAAMFGGAQGQETPAKPASAYLWRIVHAVFALSLAAYISVSTTFDGSKLGRSRPTVSRNLFGDEIEGNQSVGQRLFWLFATVQVVLQSTRYFVEKGALPSTGILGMIGGFLPEPWAGYVRTVGRYSIIYTTVVADAMVVVFVLGVVSWWRGGSVDV